MKSKENIAFKKMIEYIDKAMKYTKDIHLKNFAMMKKQ